jgi:uncharacterized membrane protein YraQ (UPF0718 family)/copper chaperone CopZ
MIDAYLIALEEILLELSLPLLAGLLLAGLLHVFLPKGFLHRHLSGANTGSVLRASLIGVPMPLCSCGVVPTAIGLRRAGASKGATTAFLISTPQTGVDSVMVTAAFLGWPFALFKLIAAFVTGLLGGELVNRLEHEPAPPAAQEAEQSTGAATGTRLLEAVRYALFDLLAAIDLWLIGGILVAAAITAAVPADYFANATWAQGVLGMLLVLLVALPLYVCTTGSVPIAASLIAAGMPPGSALVFLMAGPATNVATMGAVFRTLGGRVLAIYLGTVVVMSVGLGLTFDFLLLDVDTAISHHHVQYGWMDTSAALLTIGLLALLLGRRALQRFRAPSPTIAASAGTLTLQVQGMTCNHCVSSVKRTLEACDDVEEASPNLASGRVHITGRGILDADSLAQAVERAGYKVVDNSKSG